METKEKIKEGHLSKAFNNEIFLNTFDLNKTKHLDWAITVMFYSALHYVDAYLATKNILKVEGHPERRRHVERYLTPLSKSYNRLNEIGEDARYEIDFKITPDLAEDFKTKRYSYIKSYILNSIQKTP